MATQQIHPSKRHNKPMLTHNDRPKYKAFTIKQQETRKRVGILGGSFDPPTKGHIQVAQHVLDNCDEIDEIWLSPCYKHMHEKIMVLPNHRLKMCELTNKGNYNIGVFDFEISTNFSDSSVSWKMDWLFSI